MQTMIWIGFLLVLLLRNRLVIGLQECGTAKMFPEEASGVEMLILNGKTATSGMFPWVGFLSWFTPDNIICTISLIEPKIAITAAHCVKKGKCVSTSMAVFGIVDVEELKKPMVAEKHVFKVKNFFYPKNFNSTDFSAINDVALLELEKPVDIYSFNGTVNTICLPKPAQPVQGDLFLAGWGMTNRTVKTSSTNLQYMYSDVLPKKNCKEVTKFCVKGKKDNQTPFLGDSGGPAVQLKNGRYTMLGVLSGGDTKIATYTIVTDYLNWIKNHNPKDTENPPCDTKANDKPGK